MLKLIYTLLTYGEDRHKIPLGYALKHIALFLLILFVLGIVNSLYP